MAFDFVLMLFAIYSVFLFCAPVEQDFHCRLLAASHRSLVLQPLLDEAENRLGCGEVQRRGQDGARATAMADVAGQH